MVPDNQHTAIRLPASVAVDSNKGKKMNGGNKALKKIQNVVIKVSRYVTRCPEEHAFERHRRRTMQREQTRKYRAVRTAQAVPINHKK